MTEESQKKHHRFYDIDEFRRVHLATLNPPGRFEKFVGRITGSIDSVQGILIVMMALPITFGTVFAVAIGVSYGLIGFLGMFGFLIGGIAFYAEKRVGRSMQFGEYRMFRRILAQVLAFLVLGGIVLGLVLLSRFRLF